MSTAFERIDLGEPLCRRNPAAWDLDSSTPDDELRRSARDCVYRCPLCVRCGAVVIVGAVTPRAMVWAGRAYDDAGDVVDLDRPGLKIGRGPGRDTRTSDSAGRVYNGHTRTMGASTAATRQRRHELMAVARQRPVQQRSRNTRAALITSAATEFAQYGYGVGSVNRILSLGGLTKGSMYFHFSPDGHRHQLADYERADRAWQGAAAECRQRGL